MTEEVKVPSMGESITEAVVGQIFKPSGSVVQEQEELLELETDKVNQVLYAPAAGLLTLSVKEEDSVAIGQVIATIEPANGEQKPAQPKAKQEDVSDTEAAPSEPQPPRERFSARKGIEPANGEQKPAQPKAKQEDVSDTKAAPSEPQLPRERFSARKGVEQFVQEVQEPKQQQAPLLQKTAAPVAPSSSTGKKEVRKKMSSIRKVIAKRLVEAKQSTAMLTTFNEVDLTRVNKVRLTRKEEFLKQHGVKLGYMSFFVKAVVSALKQFPEVNAYIEGDEIIYRHYYDIGIAVGTDRGLVVPVIRDCDRLSFAQIEQAIVDVAQKARSGGLSTDDLKGAGFTITNGGVYGSLLSTPIINPPQSAILGMHAIQERPVAIEGRVEVRPMMYLALSYDHRIIDGKEAVSFLIHIKKSLEETGFQLLGE